MFFMLKLRKQAKKALLWGNHKIQGILYVINNVEITEFGKMFGTEEQCIAFLRA